MNLAYKLLKLPSPLNEFVDFIWMNNNNSNDEQEVVVLPDGRIDILFTVSSVEPYRVMLMGISAEAGVSVILPSSKIFGISFNLLAVEYLLGTTIFSFKDNVSQLPNDFWGMAEDDLNDFDLFSEKVTGKMLSLLKTNVDERKRKLFQLIYSSNGTMPIKQLCEKVFWSSLQINRYFNKQFGISLKAFGLTLFNTTGLVFTSNDMFASVKLKKAETMTLGNGELKTNSGIFAFKSKNVVDKLIFKHVYGYHDFVQSLFTFITCLIVLITINGIDFGNPFNSTIAKRILLIGVLYILYGLINIGAEFYTAYRVETITNRLTNNYTSFREDLSNIKVAFLY